MIDSTEPKAAPEPDRSQRDERFAVALDSLLEGYQVIGPGFHYLYVNDAVAAQARLARAELLGRTMMEVFPGIEGAEMFAVLRRCMEERSPQRMENELTFPDRSKGWFELRFQPVPEGVAVLSIDISQRKLAEKALRRANRALMVISECNHALVRATDEGELWREVCDIAVSKGGYRMAWIGLKADGARKTVQPVAVAGADEGYTASLDITWDDSLQGSGPTGRAIQTGEAVVARRIDTEADYEPWMKAAIERGYASSIALPFTVDGEVAGSLNIYASEPDAFGEAERALLEELALDLGYGITTLRARVAKSEIDAKYRALFENSLDAVLLTEPDGRVFAANPAACELFGRSEEEICHIGRVGLVDPDDPRVALLLEQRARSGKVSGQITMLRGDGTRFEAEISSAIFQAADGLRASMIIRDVTERVQAEARLRQSEEQFSSAFLASPAGLTITRITDGKFIEVNDAFLKMFELTREETIGSTSVELGLLTPGERRRLVDAQLQSGGLRDADLRARTKSGRVLDIIFSSRPIRIAEEDCHITTMIDVSRRKCAEDALRASEERYRRLAENLPDMLWSTDAKGNVLFVNGAVAGMLGYKPEEVLNKPVAEYLTRSSIDSLAQLLDTSRNDQPDGSHIHCEVEYIDKEGNIVPGELHAVPILNDDNVIIAIEGITRDIRERKKAEKVQDELRAQFQLAQKLESIGRLAGGVAHDFNNLLSVIISYAGFAADQLREADPIRADIVEIQNAGQRAAALTRQLLAFSRKQILEPEVLSLNKVVSGIESMLRRLLGEDIDIEVHLAESLGSVMADPGQLEQVIMNLAVNARDAMPRGGKLTIETANVELDADYAEQHVAVKPGRFVMLSVTDTGSGMDAETKAQIFEPFFTTKEKGKGTGLGLSTVYGIVKQSGGNIWVYSEPGRGTSFKVYLPRVDAPAAELQRRPLPVTATGSETVLVVEDEEAVRRLAERILRGAGYKVLTAAGGGEAMLLCEKHRGTIDLLLTDVVMPQTSGREIAERLAKANPKLKVLYMSGYTDNAIVHHGVLDPGTRFIGKPFAAAELTGKVREVLDEGETRTGR